MSDESSSVSSESLSNDPLFAELSNLTKQQLIEKLKNEGLDTTGLKAELIERLVRHESQASADTASSASTSNLGSGELAAMFKLLESQQAQQERRFNLQMQQLEYLLKKGSSSDEASQDVLKSKAVRKHKHAESALVNQKKKREESASLHEAEVLINLVEKAVHDFESFVDSNVDLISDSSFKEEISRKHDEIQLQCLNEVALAKAYTHKIKAEFEEDRLAGCLPIGVLPPIFDGNALKFPTFWDAFAPLVHENPKVSKI